MLDSSGPARRENSVNKNIGRYPHRYSFSRLCGVAACNIARCVIRNLGM